MENTEKVFEAAVEEYMLRKGGYVRGNMQAYDKEQTLNIGELVGYIKETQEKEWERYEKIYGEEVVKKFIKRFNEEVDSQGLVYVLRHGITDRGVKLRVCQFKPESTRNPELVRKYAANKVSVIRQFAYSTENRSTLDIVLALNGIPLVAMELKNPMTRQTVEHAKRQYMTDRNPKEPCFHFNRRFLVYFALDTFEVEMTTKLNGKDTRFLPFNKGTGGAGNEGSAGNPINPEGFGTAYLWEDVLTKESLMTILQRFLHISVERKAEVRGGKEVIKKEKQIIFPRYHQLDVVTKILEDVKEKGSGKNYLVQHSAGSGKSNSIGWLCLRLASLHDREDKNIFTSVIVVTDRRVLDSQLQATISGFDHTLGLIETIGEGKTSKDLKAAIQSGKKIIVTTLQKFPIIYEELGSNSGKRFAIIVDEAHSSQTGSSAQKLKRALADSDKALEEFAKIELEEEDKQGDFEDNLVKELITQGQHENLSFFAFTATPKEKTLEMFGSKQADGTYRPYHVYSMKQAIDEGFIHDVLKHYMTYKACYKLAKSTVENPKVKESEALRAIKRYETLHAYNLQQKTAIIVEHFREVTMAKIGGRAKAMVVTASRLHAVRYCKEFKKYIDKKGYTDMGVLVAFSGTVTDGEDDFTESSINVRADGSKVSEKQLPATFNEDEYKILLVAEKYQTGFDQPLLHTMYVDKQLKGAKAVQTLSRLNRTMGGKKDTFVMDFVNEREDIVAAFKPYYTETVLDAELNVNLIYDTKARIRGYNLYTDEDVEKSNKIYYKKRQAPTDLGRYEGIIKVVLERYVKLGEMERFEFKKAIRNYIRWYAYITQITRMYDAELQKEYNFLESLERLIGDEKRGTVEILDKISLEYYRLVKTFEGQLGLEKGDPSGGLTNPKSLEALGGHQETDKYLEEILNQLNEKYKGVFKEADKGTVGTIFEEVLRKDKRLRKYAQKNTAEVFQESIYPEVFKEVIHECYVQQLEAFKKIFEDKEYHDLVMVETAKIIYRSMQEAQE